MRKIILLIPLIAALCAARALARAEIPALRPGELVSVDLSAGEQVFRLIPGADMTCDVCCFPAEGVEGAVHAALYCGDAPVGVGSGALTLVTAQLRGDGDYTLRLTGTGRVWLELARRAMSRCFALAKVLSVGDEYAKVIVKPGDVHWYAVAAGESLPLVVSGLPEDAGLRLEARLFGESGRLLAEATRTAGGAFLMDFRPRAGRTYRVRVSASAGGTGLYGLRVSPGAGGLPEALLLSEDGVTLMGRERRALTAVAIPEGASGAMLWESSDADVVRVDQRGVLTGANPGVAMVTAYAAGAVRARCRVEVRRVAAQGVRLITGRVRMNVGDDLALEWSVLPENASDPRVTFEIAPAGVATVDEAGVLRAVGVGRAALTVRASDGGFEDRAEIIVAPAQKRYRALLVGEQNYMAGAAAVRLGSANSVAGMRSMLNALSFLGARYEITTALDISRDGVFEAVAEAFDGATEQDAALFYITCHGRYAHGMTVFQMSDGSELTAMELRQALDRVPGEITLLLDCCGSGGVMGAPEAIVGGATRAFGPPMFASSRYRVLASAMVDQDSYRLSFDGAAQESRMATLFARAVCEGCGWSIDAAQRRAMRADINYDDVVTLDELYNYARRRVMWYLSRTGSGSAQTVVVSPQGDTAPLFERTEARE